MSEGQEQAAEAPKKAARTPAQAYVFHVNEGGSLCTDVFKNKKAAAEFVASLKASYKVVIGKELTTVPKTVVELA